MISHQLRPSNQPITKNHHLQTQFEGLTIKSDPQVGRQTLNKFDYPLNKLSSHKKETVSTVYYGFNSLHIWII